MFYNTLEDEIENYFLDSIEVEGSTMSISIRQDGTWHNGDQVTSDDVLTQFKLQTMAEGDARLGSPDTWAGFEGIRKTGEYSIEVDLKGEYNPRLTIFDSFNPIGRTPVLWTPADVFGRFVESYADATTDEEREGARAELVEFSWPFDEAYGNGLWKVNSIGGTQLKLSLFEDHRDADGINFESVRFRPIKDPVPALRNQELDRAKVDPGTPLPDNFAWPDIEIRSSGGNALMFDHKHELYGQTEFKQAIAFLADKQQIVEVYGPEKWVPGPGNNTFLRKFEDRYLTDPIEGKLIDYGVQSKPDRAADRLESMGFTREDGQWYDDEGEPLKMTISTPAGDWSTIANTLSGQLDQFGITANVVSLEGSTWFSKFSNKSFPTPLEIWQGGSATPYDGFQRNMTGYGGGTMDYPEQPEAPPVGDPGGSLQSYDVQEMLDAALTADTEEEFTSAIQTLGWVQNYTLPCLSLTIGLLGRRVNDVGGWTFPDEEEWGWHGAIYRKMLHGDFQAR